MTAWLALMACIFTIFNKGNTPGIESNRFEALREGENGDLWLSTEGGRIARYHLGAFETYGTAQGLPEGPAHGESTDVAGHIWLLFDTGIVQWNQQTARFVPVNAPDPTISYKPIRWEAGGFGGSPTMSRICFSRESFRPTLCRLASQESERKRIAADLHDSIGQQLIIINNLALTLMRSVSPSTSNGKESETLKKINSEATLAIEEARGISYNLRPFQLDRLRLNKSHRGLNTKRVAGIRNSLCD